MYVTITEDDINIQALHNISISKLKFNCIQSTIVDKAASLATRYYYTASIVSNTMHEQINTIRYNVSRTFHLYVLCHQNNYFFFYFREGQCKFNYAIPNTLPPPFIEREGRRRRRRRRPKKKKKKKREARRRRKKKREEE